MSTIRGRVMLDQKIPKLFGCIKAIELQLDRGNKGIAKPSEDLMVFTIPCLKLVSKLFLFFIFILNWYTNIISHIAL